MTTPAFDRAAPMQFVINAASGSEDAHAKGRVIEQALQAAGRTGHLRFCRPDELERNAHEATEAALAQHGAVVAVGGDGTLNTVARAAHAAGCAMGVIAQGTFNYFARSNGIPEDPEEAAALLLGATPEPVAVQVAAVNERLFLVNASLGLYPELLEDREAYERRFGRSRLVSLWAAVLTLLRAQRRLRLQIQNGATAREVQTLTLFVGNNRLQLEQVGLLEPDDGDDEAPPRAQLQEGHVTAVMLRPIGTLEMVSLMLQGALGTLGQSRDIEHFAFRSMRVRPSRLPGRRRIKVALDGEVLRLETPLEFRVHPRPLYLLKPPPQDRRPAAPLEGEA